MWSIVKRAAFRHRLVVLFLFCVLQSQSVLQNGATFGRTSHYVTTRRSLLETALAFTSSMATAAPAFAAIAAAPQDICITLAQPGSRLGLELTDLTSGNPPQTVVAVKRIVVPTRENSPLKAGMIVRGFPNAITIQERLQQGPYPVTLKFRNLGPGGDVMSDMGIPIVTAEDALDLAQGFSGPGAPQHVTSGGSFEITNFQPTRSSCNVYSRRGDVLEIIYEAHLNFSEGVVYDSSIQRGTGLPYQMVLGSGDMLPGVDQGLYDMCPGDFRGIQIPPSLAYGARGNKLFSVPPNTPLYWKVQLVSVNSVRQGDIRTRDEPEGR
jgi:hypothetical protein